MKFTLVVSCATVSIKNWITGSCNSRVFIGLAIMVYEPLNNNQINARALIGQSALGYCAGKPTEKLKKN